MNIRIKTWQKELGVVVSILGCVWLATGGGWIESLGAIAVILTFCHTQVAFRLEEQHEQSDNPDSVHCYRWQSRYFCLKEVCWLGYFVALGAWSALVGVFVFLAYPWWRKHHRRKMKPPFEAGGVVKAEVFAMEPYGIYLKYEKFNILVKITDCSWAQGPTGISANQFTKLGNMHDVIITHILKDDFDYAIQGVLSEKLDGN